MSTIRNLFSVKYVVKVHSLSAIAEYLFSASFRVTFARADYDAKRVSAPGATISMQMFWRAANTSERISAARIAVLLSRMTLGTKGEREKERVHLFMCYHCEFGKICRHAVVALDAGMWLQFRRILFGRFEFWFFSLLRCVYQKELIKKKKLLSFSEA